MESKLNKWGNSLGLRIPHAFAKELSLKNDNRVKMYIKENELIIEPIDEEHEYKLEDLLEDGDDVKPLKKLNHKLSNSIKPIKISMTSSKITLGTFS